MAAQNWMIGDWYQWYAECRYYPYQVKPEDFTKDYIANFEPIHLTPEIMEKNGWRYDYIYKIWVYEDEDKLDFCVKIDELRGMAVSLYKNYPIIFITYVHELQHALRFCGLTDLADNLKLD